MFVPFCLFGKELDKGTETYKAKLLDATVLYGIIFHRCRLPRYTQNAFDSLNEVEGLGVVNKEMVYNGLKGWWTQFCDTLLEAVKTEAV